MKQKTIMFLLFAVGCMACGKDVEMNNHPEFKGFVPPSDFPAAVYHFSTNPVTKDGFELGKKLFYDPILSRDNTISCANCHIQSSGFTQHGHNVSHGIDDKLGTRNSPPIMNLAWSTSFMWDGGIFDLDLQPIAPITNPVEMDETIEHVLEKLQQQPSYPALFKKAFGTEEITNTRLMKALAQFMVMCISSESKYDSVMRRQGNVHFTADEEAGYNLFNQKCSGCHPPPLFTDYSFRNNGIGIGRVDDLGRYLVSLQSADSYKFKVPSLRNLDYTAPYMHDGRFYTLEAVLEHYASHVQLKPNLDPLLQQNEQLGIPLSDSEKAKIIAFLHTLNDSKFVRNSLLSEPSY